MGEIMKLLLAFLLIFILGNIVFFIVAVEPLLGLIALTIVSIVMVALFDPVTAKSISLIIMPLVVIMFMFYIFTFPRALSIWDVILIGIVLYILFIIFAGAEGMMGKAALLQSKVALKLMPAYAAVVFTALFVDPTGKLAAITLSGTILMMMFLYIAFLKDYDKWPVYHEMIGKRAYVIEDLKPKGKIRIGGEVWWAVSATNDYIPKDTKVVVVRINGLTAYVMPEEEIMRLPPKQRYWYMPKE